MTARRSRDTPRHMRAARLGTGLALCGLMLLGACSDDGETIEPGPEVTFATQSTDSSTSDGATASTAPDTAASASSAPSETVPATAPSTSQTAPVTTEPLGDPVVTLVPVGPSFEQPVDIAVRADDTTAYVVERVGRITPLRDGQAGAPVLDITDLTEGEGERGLLGLTFTPDGTTAYVNHTDNAGDTVVAEYAVGSDGTFDPASRRVLLTIDQPYANHNGGGVVIGPDGLLYIGTGDGGAADDPERRALNVSTLLGKMLRIDPTPSGDQPYTIPSDNPFVDVSGARPEIWSVGLRNPWRFSFDRTTGDLWIADVGQNEVEEINAAWASDGAGRGLNFGWSAFEGTRRFNDDQSPEGVTPPVFEYEHGDRGCSISGGVRYRGTEIPVLVGWYVYGDYCSGELTALQIDDRTVVRPLLVAQQDQNVAVSVGPDGELWAVSIGGQVARIVAG